MTQTNGHKPSPQQQAVINWARTGRDNVFIEAVAGSGKTTTLLAACRVMTPPEGARFWSVAFVAFNKKIADEIKLKVQKLKDAGIDTSYLQVGTFHSYAFKAWRKANPDVRLLKDREYNERMFTANLVPEDLWGIVGKLVNLAQQMAVCLEWQPTDLDRWYDIVEHHDLLEDMVDPEKIDDAIKLACKCIVWAMSVGHEFINFSAMLWLPTVTNCRVWQHARVLVDESQDTNPVRRAFARKMLSPRGKIAFVGDRNQAIYGFTGADNDSVDLIIKSFNCTQMPLTVSYRCPRAVVAEAQRYVSHIQAHAGAPEGEVNDLTKKEFLATGIKQLLPTDAIVCRNTRPLVALAFLLLRNGVACFVEGKDIGKGLTVLLDRWKVKSAHAFVEKLEDYRDKQVAKLVAKKQEMKAEQLTDRIETLLVLAEGCDTVKCIRDKIDRIFADRLNPDGTENPDVRNAVCLCTVHRSKGLEWPTVYILGFERYMPSKYAKKQWEVDQENNLIYVAITRAQNRLVYLEALEEPKRR